MSFTEFRAMLDVFTGTSIKTIDIMGGEPTMHADIFAFVKEAGRRGFFVNLSSNGSNLNILSNIMNLGPAVSVGISVNDRKTFEQVRGFIGERKPVVKMVFTRERDRTLIEEILSLRPKMFYLLYRDIPDKNALREAVPFHVYKADVERDFGQQVGMVYCGGFLPDAKEHSELGGVRCPAGTTKLGVMPDGSVYPCNLFFGKQDFSLGNILTDRFTDIWHHRRLSFFRTSAANPCPIRVCRFHVECHGGCPAQSLLSTGHVSSPDPRCCPA